MRDPFHLRDDACWACIAEQLEAAKNPELAAELREAVGETRQDLPYSSLESITTMHHGAIEIAAQACRLAFRCKW